MHFWPLEVQKFRAHKIEPLLTRIRFSQSYFNLAKNDFYSWYPHRRDKHSMQKPMEKRKIVVIWKFILHFSIWIQVYIKEIFINSVRKNFVPFWIDSNVDIENDPYTSDCSGQTDASKPHAYTQFTITNGELSSRNCIEKQPGNWMWKNDSNTIMVLNQ